MLTYLIFNLKKLSLMYKILLLFNRTGFYDKILWFIDIIIIFLVVSLLIHNLWDIIFSLIYRIFDLFSDTNVLCNMSSSGNNSSNTTTQVIHNDGSISNSIRSLFIYGSGALRLHLTRVSGSPGTRAFIIGSTIGADFASKFLNYTINDPNYVKSHVDS
jgi:hypothetical protein